MKEPLRKIEKVSAIYDSKTGRPEQSACLACREKFRIHVDWTSFHDHSSDWIPRIVFNDATQAPGTQNPPQIIYQ
jgi:hypothetical protein